MCTIVQTGSSNPKRHIRESQMVVSDYLGVSVVVCLIDVKPYEHLHVFE